MNIQKQIQNENNWKELAKKLVDNSKNYNDYQKELLKLLLEDYFQKRKNAIIQNDKQAKIIESLINNNKQ